MTFTCNDPLLGFLQVEIHAEPGVLDDRARLAFTAGHCHSLAVAVHDATGLPIVMVEKPGGEVFHMGVRDGDEFVDVRGRRPCTPESIMDSPSDDWLMREITVEDVRAAAEQGKTYPLQVEPARSFARTLCWQEGLTAALATA